MNRIKDFGFYPVYPVHQCKGGFTFTSIPTLLFWKYFTNPEEILNFAANYVNPKNFYG